MKIIAHRGASAEAPENSLAAFELAVEIGADMIELDLRASADGVLYVAHDPPLAPGRPAWMARRLRWSEIRALGAGTGRFPALADVLDGFAHRIALNIEIKERRAAPLLVAELERRPRCDGILLSSFDRRTALWLREAHPALTQGLLVRRLPWRLGAAAARIGARALHLPRRIVGAALVRRARSLGLPVYVWTVNEAAELRRLRALGVGGVFSDDPRRALRVLGRSAEPPSTVVG